MVAGNPLFQGGFTVRKFNSTVINDVWPETLFFTGIAVLVVCVNELTSFHNLKIESDLLGVLGTVLGLVISFRTSSAYERYQEGRKLWTTITIASRSIAQLIWIHVPVNRKPGKVDGGEALTPLQSVIEKKSMINLIQAFAVSVKHFLRSEPGIYYEDLYPLISFLPRYGSKNPAAHEADDLLPLFQASEEEEYLLSHPASGRPSATSTPTNATLVGVVEEKADGTWYSSMGKKSRRKTRDIEMGYMPSVNVHRPLKPARNPPTTGILDYLPFLRFFRWVGGLFVKRAADAASFVGVKQRNGLGKKKKTPLLDSNVPVEITMYLSSYANYILTNGFVEGPVGATVIGNITTLQDCLSNLERIRSTPLPFAYQAHLRMSLWLYLLFLPLQVYENLGWITIPGTAFAAFLFLGFLEIGAEIEDPFGYDSNDLPVDEFVLQIQREMHEITVHHAPSTREYMFSAFNQPFAPADRRSAETLLQVHASSDYVHEHSNVDHGMDSIKRTLLKSWKNVDEASRKIKT